MGAAVREGEVLGRQGSLGCDGGEAFGLGLRLGMVDNPPGLGGVEMLREAPGVEEEAGLRTVLLVQAGLDEGAGVGAGGAGGMVRSEDQRVGHAEATERARHRRPRNAAADDDRVRGRCRAGRARHSGLDAVALASETRDPLHLEARPGQAPPHFARRREGCKAPARRRQAADPQQVRLRPHVGIACGTEPVEKPRIRPKAHLAQGVGDVHVPEVERHPPAARAELPPVDSLHAARPIGDQRLGEVRDLGEGRQGVGELLTVEGKALDRDEMEVAGRPALAPGPPRREEIQPCPEPGLGNDEMLASAPPIGKSAPAEKDGLGLRKAVLHAEVDIAEGRACRRARTGEIELGGLGRCEGKRRRHRHGIHSRACPRTPVRLHAAAEGRPDGGVANPVRSGTKQP